MENKNTPHRFWYEALKEPTNCTECLYFQTATKECTLRPPSMAGDGSAKWPVLRTPETTVCKEWAIAKRSVK